MRGVSLVAIALLAGCTQLSAGPSEEKRREYDARIARELEEGTARRARQLDANRGVLDRLRPFPGAELLSEEHQGNDDTDADVSDDDVEYEVYVSDVVRPYWRYELLTSESWSSYRRYRLPAGTATRAVHLFYAQQLRGWAHLARERGRSVDGHPLFADDFWRDGRCVRVHVGLRELPRVAPRRSLTVATAALERDACL